MPKSLCKISRSGLHNLSGCLKFLFHLLIISKYVVTGQCLDTAHSCCDTALRKDLERLDICGILYMSTTQNSLEKSPIDTTRTVSPYFSPKSIVAPLVWASASDMTRHCTGVLARISAFTMSST